MIYLFLALSVLLLLFCDMDSILTNPSTPTPSNIVTATPTPILEDLNKVCEVYSPGTTLRIVLKEIQSEPEGLGNVLSVLVEKLPLALKVETCNENQKELKCSMVVTRKIEDEPAAGLLPFCPTTTPDRDIYLTQTDWALNEYGSNTSWYETNSFNLSLPLHALLEIILAKSINTSMHLSISDADLSGGLNQAGNLQNGVFTAKVQVSDLIQGMQTYLGGVYCGGELEASPCSPVPTDPACDAGFIDTFSSIPDECDVDLFGGVSIRMLIDVLSEFSSSPTTITAYEANGTLITPASDINPLDNEYSPDIFEECP